ncbi:DUF1128 domain-containing protein [Paenibacillus aquistagni]|uniref:Uncharacterized protein YfkK, UPF0435 family n=1 Tax=Paenibacillus aquistagni TaxID=1852522 RepID=A0A1X7LRH2_9BACL|nr:DUF1128 domain-containing protein [Paenibacillus aquistagni]NMM53225.1 DUF1128 domain-containing protein [Paenibacillus aquistagni]SMG55933.1 Uncharacterized protein YfkK, UPF0435 family [Paenibacillus aquistagni]
MAEQATQAEIVTMIEAIKDRLKMATAQAMQASAFSVEQYEDIKDIYDVVMNKPSFSISEMEALVSELGKLRRQ